MKSHLNKIKRFRHPTKKHLLELVETICHAENVSPRDISIAYVDNPYIQQLNKDYLDKDQPTDVIAFILSQPDEPLVGDIYISVDQARLQAAEYDVPLDNELIRLTTHGLLHVIGYDHETDDERRIMTGKEDGWVDYYFAEIKGSSQ